MGEFRLAKLGEQIRGEIALLVSTQKIKDPRVSTFLTINRVEVAADLAYAKVYVSSFLPEGQILKGVADSYSRQSQENLQFENFQNSVLLLTVQ